MSVAPVYSLRGWFLSLHYEKQEMLPMSSSSWAKWVLLALYTPLLPVIAHGQGKLTLTLETALDIAMKENPRILAAQKQIDAARGRAWNIWWLPDPALTAEYEGIPKGRGLTAFGERRISLTQAIDFPTNIFFKKKLANNDINSSRMGLEQTKLEVAAEVKKAYYDFLAKRDNLTLAMQNQMLAQEFMQKARTRYEVGEAPNLDYIRARVAAAQAENRVTQARSELIAAQAALNALLARPAEAEVEAVDSLTYQPFDRDLGQLRARAFEVHPRLRAIGYQVGMARQVRNLAWGSFLPQIEATAFRQNIDGNPNFYGIEVGVSLPLWFPFRQRGTIQEATATLNSTQWMQQNERHLLDAQIESAYAAVQSAQQQVVLYTKDLLS